MNRPNSLFQAISGLCAVTPIIMAKGTLVAMSNDLQILASNNPSSRELKYKCLASQTESLIGAAHASALTFRPNDKQYQDRGPAVEIARNELLIACCDENKVLRYIPSLGSYLKEIPVERPTAIACNATGQLLAVGTAMGKIYLYDLSLVDAKMVFASKISSVSIEQITFGVDGEHLFARDKNHDAFAHRLKVHYQETGAYLKAGGSVHLRCCLKKSTGVFGKINESGRIFPARVVGIASHPTIRQMALIAQDNKIYFWNYACATLSSFECPLDGPLTGFFSQESDHFVVSSREGAAIYCLSRRQKKVATPTSAGGPYPVQYEVQLSAGEAPVVYPSRSPGSLIRCLVERHGTCFVAYS